MSSDSDSWGIVSYCAGGVKSNLDRLDRWSMVVTPPSIIGGPLPTLEPAAILHHAGDLLNRSDLGRQRIGGLSLLKSGKPGLVR